jgi:hypothetical protein
MLERITNHVNEREAITDELKKIMTHCDSDSPIDVDITSEWQIDGDELRIGEDDKPIDENKGNYYSYTISSMGAKGKELFIGEKDGITYVMAYPDNWRDTVIYVLDNKNRTYGEEN